MLWPTKPKPHAPLSNQPLFQQYEAAAEEAQTHPSEPSEHAGTVHYPNEWCDGGENCPGFGFPGPQPGQKVETR
jgi:hypothetical protein